MNFWRFSAVAVAITALVGCERVESSMQAATGHGPYSGVGLYGPGRQWTKLAANQAAKDKDSARAIDDQVVIVVQNTATGEVRACGDLTGYCIGMNPWKAPLLASQVSPVKMTSHVEADEPDATVERRVRPEKACKRRKHSEAGSGGQAHEPGETSGSTQS